MKILLLLIASLMPVAVYATPPALKAHAESAYQAGVDAFGQQDFDGALKLFDQAFKLDPSPILLYNIARCHEEMGTLDPAIRNFELYLVRAPDAPDRADVERRIRVMEAITNRQAAERAIAERETAERLAAAQVEPAPARSSQLRWWGYGALGAGVVGVAVGAGFGSAADTAAADHRAAKTPGDKVRFEDDANSKASLANVGYVVGGALIAAGAGILIYDAVSDDSTVEVAPGPTGLSMRVTF